MSFSRSPLYVWSDGINLHIWIRPDVPKSIAYVDPVDPEDYQMEGGIAIDEKQFIEVALAVMSNYSPKQLSNLCRNVAKPDSPFAGNFSLDHDGLEAIHTRFTPKGKTLWPEGVCESHPDVHIRNGKCFLCGVETDRAERGPTP